MPLAYPQEERTMSVDHKRDEAAKHLKDLIRRENPETHPANLDQLIELLDADDLRNVVGMLRPKGRTDA